MDRLDIHKRRRKLELAVKAVKASPRISERNRKTILSFHDYCFVA